MCNLVVRWGVKYPQWGEEVPWQIEKVQGVTDMDKQRPIKLLEVLRKCVQGVLQQRVDRGVERMGLMHEMQAAFRAEMSTSISLLHITLMSEWCIMHNMAVADQGHDVRKAYDSVNAPVKEVAMMRMGVGQCWRLLSNYLVLT